MWGTQLSIGLRVYSLKAKQSAQDKIGCWIMWFYLLIKRVQANNKFIHTYHSLFLYLVINLTFQFHFNLLWLFCDQCNNMYEYHLKVIGFQLTAMVCFVYYKIPSSQIILHYQRRLANSRLLYQYTLEAGYIGLGANCVGGDGSILHR